MTTSANVKLRSWTPNPVTTPLLKRTSEPETPSMPPATGAIRSMICSHAFFTAPPLRSVPELAAVAEVLGTLSVRVGANRTLSSGIPNAVAATCSIFV